MLRKRGYKNALKEHVAANQNFKIVSVSKAIKLKDEKVFYFRGHTTFQKLTQNLQGMC